MRAPSVERTDVRRRRAPLPGDIARRPHGLAGGTARSVRRAGARGPPPQPPPPGAPPPHRRPAHPWTIEALARNVGLSRSALAERFMQFVGQPPMHYLTNWRMQLAANQLRSGIESVAVIANLVG